MIEKDKCESCRERQVEILESNGDILHPYKVCKHCHKRLVNRALRPLEYFNLAALHGHWGLLNDDFYDDDGTAYQSETDVKFDENLKFPDLPSIQNDINKLIDYAFVKWWFPDEITPLLLAFEKHKILETLKQKIIQNENLRFKAYEISAKVLKDFAADWIREEWANSGDKNIVIFAEALAECLPEDEGSKIALDYLSRLSSKELRENIHCLMYFQNPKALNFIENIKDRIVPVTYIYGSVTAASSLTWERAEVWLKEGRPLSLIALDAICDCAATQNSVNRALWLREHPPKLLEPKSIEEMNRVLDNYLKHDNVPRTRTAIEFIKNNWKLILKETKS